MNHPEAHPETYPKTASQAAYAAGMATAAMVAAAETTAAPRSVVTTRETDYLRGYRDALDTMRRLLDTDPFRAVTARPSS